jgi:hypothetical protein
LGFIESSFLSQEEKNAGSCWIRRYQRERFLKGLLDLPPSILYNFFREKEFFGKVLIYQPLTFTFYR